MAGQIIQDKLYPRPIKTEESMDQIEDSAYDWENEANDDLSNCKAEIKTENYFMEEDNLHIFTLEKCLPLSQTKESRPTVQENEKAANNKMTDSQVLMHIYRELLLLKKEMETMRKDMQTVKQNLRTINQRLNQSNEDEPADPGVPVELDTGCYAATGSDANSPDADCDNDNILNTSKDMFENYDQENVKLQQSSRSQVLLSETPNYQMQVEGASCSENKQMNGRSKNCPVCNKVVKVLSKHLKTHNIDESKRISMLFFNRKRKTPLNKARKCPFPECKDLPGYMRLDHHFLKKHKMAKTDDNYRMFIRPYNSMCKNKVPELELEQQAKSNKFSNFATLESEKFKDNLKLLSGGHFIFNAQQQAYKIRQILNGANITSTENIAGDVSRASLENYITEYSKTHEYSSSVTMCSTLICYLNFLIAHCKGDFIAISSFIKMINRWKKAFRKGKGAKENAHVEISV